MYGPVHHDDRPDPSHLGPEHGCGDHGVDHGDIGRFPLQFLGHIAAELAGRPAQLPVPDPPPLAQWIAGLPVLDQVGLGLRHVVIRGVLIPQECCAGRFEPGPQPFGAQHPHLVPSRDRPPHHGLNGFDAPPLSQPATKIFSRPPFSRPAARPASGSPASLDRPTGRGQAG